MQSSPPLPPLRIPLRRPHDRRSRRRAGVALGIAVGVHTLALVLGITAVRHARDVDPATRSRPQASPAEQVEYLDVAAWPRTTHVITPPRPPGAARSLPAAQRGAGEASSDTTSSRAPDAPVDAPGASAGADPGVGAVSPALPPQAPGGSARGPLGGRIDPRLVVTGPPAAARAADRDEPYLAEFRAALRAFNDSIQDQADRDRRAASWTWTDPRGRVWGFRQGVLMIAGQGTLNVEMQGERAQELLARQQARARREGQAQAERIERDRYLQERGRAIRERRDRERAAVP
jgi:hypothetical protein